MGHFPIGVCGGGGGEAQLTRNPQLDAWTETEKPALFTNKKVQAVAGTTDKLFCEEKRAGFYIESRDPTGDFGLSRWPLCKDPVQKSIARILLAILLFARCGIPLAAASDLWSDRRRVLDASRARSAAEGPSNWEKLAASFPLFDRPVSPAPWVDPRPSALPQWLDSTVGLSADIGEFFPPAGQEKRVLLHLQDLHDVQEAQRHIADVLERLSAGLGGTAGLWVGLEGAAGEFQAEAFCALAPPSVRARAFDRLLRAGRVSGPEFFSVTTVRPFRLWGVEDPAAYNANVRALKETFPTQTADDQIVQGALKRVAALKQRVYPAPLQELDRLRQRYEAGEVSFAVYAQALARGVSSEQTGPVLHRFLEAVRLEGDFSDRSFQEEQKRLLDVLVPRLKDGEVRRLVEAGLAYRLGRSGPGTFYDLLERLCTQHDVPYARHSALVAHAASLKKMEGLRPAMLLTELQRLEDRRFRSLLSTPVLSELWSLAEDTRLVAKLNRFEMTPEDHRRWESRRGAVARWQNRMDALERSVGFSGKTSEPVVGQRPDLLMVAKRHAPFYRWVEARNVSLVGRLLSRWTGPEPAVLVTGGYHADGIRSLALARGLGYVSLVPRVIKTTSFPPPLESFREVKKRGPVFLPACESLHRALLTARAPLTSQAQVSDFLGEVLAVVIQEILREISEGGPERLASLRREVRRLFGLGLGLPPEMEPTAFRFSLSSSSEVREVRCKGNASGGGAFSVQQVAVPFYHRWGSSEGFRDFLRRAGGGLAGLWDSLGFASRRTAVFLMGPVRLFSGSGAFRWLENLRSQWAESIQLSQERRAFGSALGKPFIPHSRYLLSLAQRHVVPWDPRWGPVILDGLTKHAPSSFLAEGNQSRISLEVGGERVSLQFSVTNARVLSENPDAYFPYQLNFRGEGQFDVFLDQSVVSDPDGLWRIISGRLVEEISLRFSGRTAEEAFNESRRPEQEVALRQKVLALLLRGEIDRWSNALPTFSVSTSLTSALGRLKGMEGGNLENVSLGVGLQILTGAVSNPISGFLSYASLENPEVLQARLTQLGLPGPLAAGRAQKMLEVSLAESTEALRLFQQMASQRDLLTRLSWTDNSERLAAAGGALAVRLLKNLGSRQGQRVALDGRRYEEALHEALNTQFPSLVQTLAGVVALCASGARLHSQEAMDSFIADAWTLYAAYFQRGYDQLAVRPSGFLESGEGKAESGAVWAPLIRGPVERSPEVRLLLDRLMQEKRNRPSGMALLWSEGAPPHPDALLASLDRLLLENHPTDSLERRAVRAFLHEADRVVVLAVSAKQVSLDRVLNSIQQIWKNVGRVFFVCQDPSVFLLDASPEIAWAIYDPRGMLLSASVAAALAEKRLRAVFERQA